MPQELEEPDELEGPHHLEGPDTPRSNSRSTRLLLTGALAMATSAVLTFGLVRLTSGSDSADAQTATSQAPSTSQASSTQTLATQNDPTASSIDVDVPPLGDISGLWGVGRSSQMTVDGRSATDLEGQADVVALTIETFTFMGQASGLGEVGFQLTTPMQLRQVPTPTELQGVVATGSLSMNGITREISSLLTVGPARTGMDLTGEIFIDPAEFELSGDELLVDIQLVLER